MKMNYMDQTNNNLQPEQRPTRKEQREFKRQEKLKAREAAMQKRRTQRIVNWTISLALVILPVGGLIWYGATRPSVPESDIASRVGLHWHPELTIYAKGVKQSMPANLGAGGSYMASIHTHQADGVIHLEFQGLVRKSDIALGQLFKSWGKDIRSFGTNMKMTVNGQENTEYENYIMQDKDKIELHFD